MRGHLHRTGQSDAVGNDARALSIADALGSTNAVADANGTVLENDYYDSWGLRSNPDGTPLANLPLFHSFIHAGFTSQEHDDGLKLINLQGRMYDPTLGRFLSPDPLVSDPAFSQSWNAYSYVLNSPINFTDPSGFDACPAGYDCFDGVGNENKKTIHYKQSGNETFGDGGSASLDASNVGAAAAGAINSTVAMLQDLQRMAEQQHKLDEIRKGHLLPDGTRIRSADGTPILPHWINHKRGNAAVTNWGLVIRGKNVGPLLGPKKSPPANTESLLTRWLSGKRWTSQYASAVAARAVRPADLRIRANRLRPPSSSAIPQVARNAIVQVITADSLRRGAGKAGVIIDEGVEGILDRLMPGGIGMANDPSKPPSLELRLGEADEFELTPEEELEDAIAAHNRWFSSYNESLKRLDEARRVGTDRYGNTVDWAERGVREQKKALDEAAAVLDEIRAKFGKTTPP